MLAIGSIFKRKLEAAGFMRVCDVPDEEAIKLCLKASTKKEVLNELVAQAIHETVTTREAILKRPLEREALGSTAIEAGVAVPHAVIDGLPKPKAVLTILDQPLDFDATDDLPVDIFSAFDAKALRV